MIEYIVFAILFVVLLFVLYKFFKFFFKIFAIVSFILFVLVCIFGFFIIRDAMDFKNNFGNSTNTFILKDNQTILTGMNLNPGKSLDDKFQIIETAKLNELQKDIAEKPLINQKNMDALRAKYKFYKFFVVDIEAIKDIPDDKFSIEIAQNQFLTKNQSIEVLKNPKILNKIMNISDVETNTLEQKGYYDKMKGFVFANVLIYYFNPKNSVSFFGEIKSGNIEIYDETILFKSLKFIPKAILDDVTKTLDVKQAKNETLVAVANN